jgi:hypothetical protein
MKPAPFEYFAPRAVPEALELLAEHGDDAKILAGGQSLVPMMNFRLVRPRVLVDINHVAGLSYIRESEGRLLIGAMTRHRDVERSAVVERLNGLLFNSIRHVDFWWWNELKPPMLLGWLSVPMLYQLGILLCGWALAVYAAGHLWKDDA